MNKKYSVRAIVLLLITALVEVASIPKQSDAMLAPVSAVQTAAPAADRAEDVATIQKALESKILRSKLQTLGLSKSEIDARLSKMSDEQVHQFASQIRAVNPAGDAVVYVLVVVVLVLFIIWLVKRI